MRTKKTKAPQGIYQLKVILIGTNPPIWRRLLVPAEFTLAKLHDVLQAAMGWQNYHLHEFRIDNDLFGSLDPDLTPTESEPCIDENKVCLFDVLNKPGATGKYIYDLGDNWEHSIVVEKIIPPESGLNYPLCIAGELHSPPEDCGGIGKFYDLLEAVHDPKHDDHDEMLDWLDDIVHLEPFSIDAVNRRLPQPFRLDDWK